MPSQREFSHQLSSPGHPSPKWLSQVSKGLAEASKQHQPPIRDTGRLVPPSAFLVQHQVFPGGARGKEPACQCRRHNRLRFNPWVRKIPWGIAWQPTPVFVLGESSWTKEPGGLQSIKLQRVRRNLAHTHAYTHTHTHTHTPYLLHSLVY